MKGSAEIFLAALDAIREPLFVLSDGGQLIFANKAFWIAIGSDSQPPVGSERKSPWFWPQMANTELKAEPFTTVFLCPDGKESTVHLRAITLEGGNHLIQLLEGLQGAEPNRDFHAQRLQTLGMLASGVAHDFNNILTGILGHVAYLKAAAKLEGQPFESLLSVEEGSKKATDIVQQILQFSKIETSERLKTINLSQLVERTCRLLRGAISAKYQLQVKNIQPAEILPATSHGLFLQSPVRQQNR